MNQLYQYYHSQPGFSLQSNPPLMPFNQTPFYSGQQLQLQYMNNPSIQLPQQNSNPFHQIVPANIASIQTQQGIQVMIQANPQLQQNLSQFQQFSPISINFIQNNQPQSAIFPSYQPIFQQTLFQNELQLHQYQQQQSLIHMKQLQQVDQQQQQMQQQLISQQIFLQQQHQLASKEQIIFQNEIQKQTHKSQSSDQPCRLSNSNGHTFSPDQIGNQSGEDELSQKIRQQVQSVSTVNLCKSDNESKNSTNCNKHSVDSTKRQTISSQQQSDNSSSFLSPKKHKKAQKQQQKTKKVKLSGIIAEHNKHQEEQVKKQQLLEELPSSEMKENVNISIRINRQCINRNLIKGFTNYVNKQVKYILNYEKLSAGKYHFKSCQHMPVLLNRNPNSKEREMFRKKFNKFIKSKQYPKNSDLQQIVENRLYCILFKEFLESDMAETICLHGRDKQSEYTAVIQFYLLCMRDTRYLIFINDLVSLNKKHITNGSPLEYPFGQDSQQSFVFPQFGLATSSVSQIHIEEQHLKMFAKEQISSEHKNNEISVMSILPQKSALNEKNPSQTQTQSSWNKFQSIQEAEIKNQQIEVSSAKKHFQTLKKINLKNDLVV